jgi:hypothetical protein
MPDRGLSRKPQIAGGAGRGRIVGLGPADRVRFACFFCNIFQKHRSEGFPRAVFMLRVQEASVILWAATEGGTRGRFRRFAGIPAHAGEARALRS